MVMKVLENAELGEGVCVVCWHGDERGIIIGGCL